jgi:hypothetical protein
VRLEITVESSARVVKNPAQRAGCQSAHEHYP